VFNGGNQGGGFTIMNTLLRGGCLAVYLLALVGVFAGLPFGIAATLRYVALVLLGAHLLEVLFAFSSIRRYRGPLAVSVGLTLLFGFLHWMPLAKRS
jgi:hypothetical protein